MALLNYRYFPVFFALLSLPQAGACFTWEAAPTPPTDQEAVLYIPHFERLPSHAVVPDGLRPVSYYKKQKSTLVDSDPTEVSLRPVIYYKEQKSTLVDSDPTEVIVMCDAGDRATGGGFDLHSEPTTVVTGSQWVEEQGRPYEGWAVRVSGKAGSEVSAKVACSKDNLAASSSQTVLVIIELLDQNGKKLPIILPLDKTVGEIISMLLERLSEPACLEKYAALGYEGILFHNDQLLSDYYLYVFPANATLHFQY